jgi:oxygen-independent coproporphyrinogen-3 oxidase
MNPVAAPSLPTKTTVGNYFISNYPPFSCWNAGAIPEFLATLCRVPEPAPLGLYVHLPFCRQRCQYCYFRVHPRPKADDIECYIDSLLQELSLYSGFTALRGRHFSSLYFGGGSPSYLEPDQIRRLLRGLQKSDLYKPEAMEEATFECEPGTVSLEKFRALKQCGITRVSLGFQSLNDDILRRNGRRVTLHECHDAFEQARAAGFDEINIDLLAGLPGETSNSWQRTIERVIDLAPECVTIYQLELTHNSGLYESIRSGRDPHLPDWPTKRNWLEQAFEMLEHVGYTIGSGYMAIREPARWRFVYTVEHFWHGADLLALGETAFGHIQGFHYQNADTFEGYTDSIASGKFPLRRALRLRPQERLRREIILHLKTGCLDVNYFRQKFGVDLEREFAAPFESLRRENLLEVDGGNIRLNRRGLLEVDWLLPRFYLPEHVGVRYS